MIYHNLVNPAFSRALYKLFKMNNKRNITKSLINFATFNVLSLNSQGQSELLTQTLLDQCIDICCVQETRGIYSGWVGLSDKNGSNGKYKMYTHRALADGT